MCNFPHITSLVQSELDLHTHMSDSRVWDIIQCKMPSQSAGVTPMSILAESELEATDKSCLRSNLFLFSLIYV